MSTLRYNIRSVLFRKLTSLGVTVSITVAVFITAGTSMLLRGVQHLFVGHASPTSVIVMGKGTTQEFGSAMSSEVRSRILALPQIARRPDGTPSASAELVQLLNLDRSDGSGGTNVIIRGVSEDGLRIRPHLKVIDGRMAKPGTDEAIVGKTIVGRVNGVSIGSSLPFGAKRSLKIVGVFEDAGSATESELFADLAAVQEAFGQAGFISTVRLELRSPGDFDAVAQTVAAKPILMEARRTTDFEREQAGTLSFLVTFLGGALGTLLTMAAVLGALVGMHGSVSARVREFGTMRALGFSAGSIVRGVLVEAIVLAAVGAAVGTIAALALVRVELTMMGPNWASVVLHFEPSPGAFGAALVNALAIALIGAAVPATRAMRITPTEALRS